MGERFIFKESWKIYLQGDLSSRALIMVSESSSQYWQALVNVKNYYRLVFYWKGLHLGEKNLIGRVFFKIIIIIIIIRKWGRKWCPNFLLDYSLIVYKNHVNFMYWKCGRLNLGNLGLCYISCQWNFNIYIKIWFTKSYLSFISSSLSLWWLKKLWGTRWRTQVNFGFFF